MAIPTFQFMRFLSKRYNFLKRQKSHAVGYDAYHIGMLDECKLILDRARELGRPENSLNRKWRDAERGIPRGYLLKKINELDRMLGNSQRDKAVKVVKEIIGKASLLLFLCLGVVKANGVGSCVADTPDCTLSHDTCHLDHCLSGSCVQDIPAPDGWHLCNSGSAGVFCCGGSLNVVATNANCANPDPCSGNSQIPTCQPNGTINCFGSCTCCSGMTDVSGTCIAPPPPPPGGCPNPGETNPHSSCQGPFICTQLSSCGVGNCTSGADCAPPPPPPPPTLCGANVICGSVNALDGSAPLVSNVAIQLLDQTARPKKLVKTTAAGPYNYALPAMDGEYVLRPVVGRTQMAIPAQIVVHMNSGVPTPLTVNFKVRMPASVHISGVPAGTFAMLTYQAYTGAQPPDTTSGMMYQSSTAGQTGLTIAAYSGTAYHLTCWIPTARDGQRTTFPRRDGETIIAPMDPNQTVEAQCP